MKFKNSIFAVLMVISQIPALGQIGIGTNNPEGLLDISMTQGFVYPRVNLVNTGTATITTPDGNPPVIGTMVYNTKNSVLMPQPFIPVYTNGMALNGWLSSIKKTTKSTFKTETYAQDTVLVSKGLALTVKLSCLSTTGLIK